MSKSRACKGCGSTTRKLSTPGPRCATCHRERKKEQREKAFDRRLRKTYGITAKQYWQLWEFQGGRCYLCRRATGAVKRLAVDHDHRSGVVRGLLCSRDNLDVVGHSRDDPEYFRRGIEYLTDPPAVRLFGRIRVP